MKVTCDRNREKEKDPSEFAVAIDRSISKNKDTVNIKREMSIFDTSVSDWPTIEKGDMVQDTKNDTLSGRKRGRYVKRKLINENFEKEFRKTEKLAKHKERDNLRQSSENEKEEIIGNRRSSRKRKVSSRLKDTEWETPKQQLVNKLRSLSDKDEVAETQGCRRDIKNKALPKQKVVAVKADTGSISMENKEWTQGTLERETAETSNVSIENKEMVPDIFEKETDEIVIPVIEKLEPKIVKEHEECSEITTDTACPADFSASEVLLSLSKTKDDTKPNCNGSISEENHKKEKVVGKPATKTAHKKKHKKYIDHITDIDKNEPKVKKKRGLPLSKRRDLTCETCGKVGTAAMIKYHEECHSNEKPYICEVCGKGYKTRGCLVVSNSKTFNAV